MIDRITPSRIGLAPGGAARTGNAVVARAALGAPALTTPQMLVAEPRRIAAADAPLDMPRIDRLRAALADGSYTIDPERIAAAMIAAEQTL